MGAKVQVSSTPSAEQRKYYRCSDVSPYEEQCLFKEVVLNIAKRSGTTDKVYCGVFKEYYNFPVFGTS